MVDDLEKIYRQHADQLIRYATAIVGSAHAADAVSDAVVGILRRGGGFDDIPNPKGYLYRAVHNAAVDLATTASRRQQREIRAHLLDGARPDQPADLDLLERLTELSPRQRSVLWLAYWEDLTPTQIATVLDISEGTVRRHLARARAAMRTAMEEAQP